MPRKRPNILLITSDQQHFSALGKVNPRIKTPALDRLCDEGTRFDRAYCPNPTCTPTRASILTGQYPSTHGAWTLGTGLNESALTVGALLEQAGYDTTLIGKAHFHPLGNASHRLSLESQPLMRDLDFWRKFKGPWYGFRNVEIARMHADESHAGQHYAIWMEERGLKNWRDYFWPWPHTEGMLRRQGTWDLPEQHHYSVWTADRTIAHIDRAADTGQPFFMWASFHDPHPPYLVPKPWDTMYDPADMEPGTIQPGELEHAHALFKATQEENPDIARWYESGFAIHGLHSHLAGQKKLKEHMAIYYGMTSLMDREIGRILARLDALGMADDTVVVFTSDHGHFLGQHGLVAKGPFHYEDLLRVPFIVRHPGRVPAGKTSNAIQSLVDLAPSFLETAGVEAPPCMQGVSQSNTWAGGDDARDHAIVENRHDPTSVHLNTYVTQTHKLTVYRQGQVGELFDLTQDPEERKNLWNDPKHASLKASLMHKAVQAEMVKQPLHQPRVSGA